MTEQRAEYRTTSSLSTIPRDLFNFWRRVLKLVAGNHLFMLHIPERQSEPITWTYLGGGKEENGGT
jgi:hypothetical protein